jgi:putative membrane protein
MKRAPLMALLMLPAAAALAANSMSDKDFVEEAAQGGMAEVELGRLAAQKGSSGQVKTFGQQMVSDHERANQKLMMIASGKGLKVPTDTDAMHKMAKKRMEGMSGAEFDTQYLKSQVADHEKMVKLMSEQSKSGKDPELKAFAAETLPIVQRHLDMVKSMQQGGAGTHDAH